jgi:hypothetical protein
LTLVVEGNGYITTGVLREILHELDPKLSPDDLDTIIEEIDEDGSGTIDFDGTIFFFQFKNKIEIKLGYLFSTEFMEMMVCIFPVFSYKLFTIDVDY